MGLIKRIISIPICKYLYRPDDVIVKDSRESKYIIVVKAVRCKFSNVNARLKDTN